MNVDRIMRRVLGILVGWSSRKHSLISCVVVGLLFDLNVEAEEPPLIDYCSRLQQEVQGKKHGFLAGNVSYYVGGFHASWNLIEDETIGLTHPFSHDLRSRGSGLLESELEGSEHTGVGNDFLGWEFYKDTRVLYGSVLIEGEVYKHPKPTQMYWRPDRMICEYEVAGVKIREEKFIGSNDAAASIIRSSEPIQLQFSGHSFLVRNSVQSTASLEVFPEESSIVITEGGTVKARPDPDGPERVGPIVYEGMTTVLASSRRFSEDAEISEGPRGEKKYQFVVPCDENGVSVAWAMHDDPAQAIRAAREILKNDTEMLAAKSQEMNELLSRGIPQFRCSEEKFEEIYYYLWALYLMYYIDVQSGWEMESHTQTAVNNFLGIHRYDACFQIKVGAWAKDKSRFAYGNVLTWKHLVESGRYREMPDGIVLLSDNKGTTWHSGAYGAELSEHVRGAWQIYEHTGDTKFVRDCYEGYFRRVFWSGIPWFGMNQFEVAEALADMAEISGFREDCSHWEGLLRQDPEHIRRMFDQRWEMNGHPDYFAGGEDGMLMTNAFWAMRSKHFPREYADRMVQSWALNRERGFMGAIFPRAMSAQAMKRFATPVDHSFGYTPDTAYFTLDGMFSQGIADVASRLTVQHLGTYNYHEKWGLPVAPEAYRRDLQLFGDQYSNFNAGKILLFLEGLAGISYSLPQKTFRVRDALPQSWDWMELMIPVDEESSPQHSWVKVRVERTETSKKITVENSPLDVIVEPWLEGGEPVGDSILTGKGAIAASPSQPGRISYRFPATEESLSILQVFR